MSKPFTLTSIEICQYENVSEVLVKVLKRHVIVINRNGIDYFKQDGSTECEVSYGRLVEHANFAPSYSV